MGTFLGTLPTARRMPCSDCFGSYMQCTSPAVVPRKSWLILACQDIDTIEVVGIDTLRTHCSVLLSQTCTTASPEGVPAQCRNRMSLNPTPTLLMHGV